MQKPIHENERRFIQMKRILLLTLTAMCVVVTGNTMSFAADITVGAAAWYAWMDKTQDDCPKEELGSTLLYGPALSAKFNEDYNLTFIFLYGKFDTLDRIDSDLALNYRLNDYFKVFAGIKYLGHTQAFIVQNSLGPALGVSAAYPVIDDLFLLATMSGLYLWGTEKFDNSIISNEKDLTKYGINGTLALAYYLADFSTAISLGGRYQHLKTDFDGDGFNYNTAIYGITLTATYTFGI
jgi:hypothetical protein